MSEKELRHVSLFSGIGGIDLAAQRAGFKTVCFVEIDKYCQKVLKKHWPDVPLIEDVRDVTKEKLRALGIETVTLISGGYPCQGESIAGKRRGKADDRWLWPEMFRVIQELRPTWVLGENVANHINMGLETVLSDLESAGYEVQPFLIPACAVKALHIRKRAFILAYSGQPRRQQNSRGSSGNESKNEGRPTEPDYQPPGDGQSCGNGFLADSYRQRLEELRCTEPTDKRTRGQESKCGNRANPLSYTESRQNDRRERGDLAEAAAGREGSHPATLISCEDVAHPTIRGEQSSSAQCDVRRFQNETLRGIWDSDYWEVEPSVGRVVDGLPHRVDRLRALGNAVVPQQVYPLLKAIAEIERSIDNGEEN